MLWKHNYYLIPLYSINDYERIQHTWLTVFPFRASDVFETTMFPTDRDKDVFFLSHCNDNMVLTVIAVITSSSASQEAYVRVSVYVIRPD